LTEEASEVMSGTVCKEGDEQGRPDRPCPFAYDPVGEGAMSRYSKDGAFNDPVVRCDVCQRLLLVDRLRTEGACVCGSRKVRNVFSFNPEEMAEMKDWGIDTEFLALFEETSGAGVSNVRH
jgi:hypothetical protein